MFNEKRILDILHRITKDNIYSFKYFRGEKILYVWEDETDIPTPFDLTNEEDLQWLEEVICL